ncbi:MAG: hypothetical protein ACI32B_07200 [Erysipelotrichaceae bacterium]
MKKEMKQKKIKIVLSIMICVAILGLTGKTLAWFRYLQQLNTVALVQIPSKITISGANRSEMTRISLELTPDDDITGDGQVTIRRVFCIESTDNFWLEVIRTTNIKGMNIKIYPVKATNSDLQSGTVKGTDGVNTYYYTPEENFLEGSYLNKVENQYLAIQKDNDRTLHDENYVEGDTVQKNAEPLYWRTENNDSADKKEVFNLENYSTVETATDGMDMYYRYYVLEISWNTTDQETDLVYLLASH